MVCLHTDTMGVHPACILFDGQGYSPPRPGIPPETTPPILHILPLIAHQLASARNDFLRSRQSQTRHGQPLVNRRPRDSQASATLTLGYERGIAAVPKDRRPRFRGTRRHKLEVIKDILQLKKLSQEVSAKGVAVQTSSRPCS